jgi:hypothetical protein
MRFVLFTTEARRVFLCVATSMFALNTWQSILPSIREMKPSLLTSQDIQLLHRLD